MVWYEFFDVDLSTWQKVLTFAGVMTVVILVLGLAIAFAYSRWEAKRKAAKSSAPRKA